MNGTPSTAGIPEGIMAGIKKCGFLEEFKRIIRNMGKW